MSASGLESYHTLITPEKRVTQLSEVEISKNIQPMIDTFDNDIVTVVQANPVRASGEKAREELGSGRGSSGRDFLKIVDDILLLLVQPAREGN